MLVYMVLDGQSLNSLFTGWKELKSMESRTGTSSACWYNFSKDIKAMVVDRGKCCAVWSLPIKLELYLCLLRPDQRECKDIPDVLGTRKHHHQPIDPNATATGGRQPGFENFDKVLI